MGFLDIIKAIGHVVPVAGPVIDAIDGYGTKGDDSGDGSENGGPAGGFLGTALKAFTNGSNGPSPASAISTTAGGIEKARMDAMIQQAMLQQAQDRNAQSRARLALDAPGMEAHNAARGDILANSKDAEFTGLPSYIHVPHMSGGLRPSMLSDSSRQLGANMSRQAMLNNLSGKDVPDLTPLPEAGAYDKILQGVGTGAGFLNAASGLFKPSPSSASPVDPSQPIYGPNEPPQNDPSQIDQGAGGTGGLDPAILDWWAKQSQPGVQT